MAKPSMPTGSDVENVIRSLGLFDPDDLVQAFVLLDTATFAAAAVRQWEEETGWVPFLADVRAEVDGGVDVTRFYDPQGPNWMPHTLGGGYPMSLGVGLVQLTSVTTGVTSTSAGTVQTLDTDFWLTPYNADELLRPWTALEWTVRQWGARRSIKVIGRFGYAGAVPDDVWLAIVHQGVRLALPEVATNITGGGTKFTELGVTEDLPEGFLLGKNSLGERWEREWKDAVHRYLRVVV